MYKVFPSKGTTDSNCSYYGEGREWGPEVLLCICACVCRGQAQVVLSSVIQSLVG